jgi:hypothetical protein
MFCQQLQPPQPVVQPLPCVGLGLYRSTTFNLGVELDGRTMDNIDHPLVVQFFQFVEGMVLFRRAVKLKTWMNCHAKMEASHYRFPVLVRFSVGNFAEVLECCRRIKTHAATYVRVHRLDLQASLDLSISNDKLCRLLFEALCPTHAPIERTSVLGRFQFAAMITKAFCTLNRGNELRDLTLCMCFVPMLETIGNYGGTDCRHFVSNKAKRTRLAISCTRHLLNMSIHCKTQWHGMALFFYSGFYSGLYPSANHFRSLQIGMILATDLFTE